MADHPHHQREPGHVRQAPACRFTSQEEVGGPETAWCDNTCLDKYFIVSGPGLGELAKPELAPRGSGSPGGASRS